MILVADRYKSLPEHCRIINPIELDTMVHVGIPSEYYRGSTPFKFIEVESRNQLSVEDIIFDKIHPWVDIPVGLINTNPGKHTYELSFYKNGYIHSVFFSYIMQIDDPETPYIYMNREVSSSAMSE